MSFIQSYIYINVYIKHDSKSCGKIFYILLFNEFNSPKPNIIYLLIIRHCFMDLNFFRVLSFLVVLSWFPCVCVFSCISGGGAWKESPTPQLSTWPSRESGPLGMWNLPWWGQCLLHKRLVSFLFPHISLAMIILKLSLEFKHGYVRLVMKGHKEFLVSCFFQEVGSRTYTDLKKSTQWGEKKKYAHSPKLSNLPTFIFHASKRIFYISCKIKLNFMTFILWRKKKW